MKTEAVASTSKMTSRAQSGSNEAFIGIIPSSLPSLASHKSLSWTQNFCKSFKTLLKCSKALLQAQSKKAVIRQTRLNSIMISTNSSLVQPHLRNWKCWWNSGWKISLKGKVCKQTTWYRTSTDGWPTQQAVNYTILFFTDLSTRWWKNTFKA